MRKLLGIIGVLLAICAAQPATATVNTTTSRVKYTCNGSTTTYAYPFQVYEDDDLLIAKAYTSSGAETILVLNVDYTVTGAGGVSGGNVVLSSGGTCASGYTLTILRNVELTQDTDYIDGDAPTATTLETPIDKLTILHQQQGEELDRAIKLPKTSSLYDIDVPVSPGRVIGWNSAGNELTTYAATSVFVTDPSYSVNARDYGDGTCTGATIAAAVAAIGSGERTLALEPCTWTLSSSVAIPSNIALYVAAGAVISPGNYDLTINGPLIASSNTIANYTGTGRLKGSPRVELISLYWFGAIGDDSTDNSDAIDYWFEFIQQAHGIGFIPYGSFKFTEQIVQTGGNYTIEGVGPRLSQLCPTGSSAEIILKSSSSALAGHIQLRNFGIRGDSPTEPSGTAGLTIQNFNLSRIRDVDFRNIDGYGLRLSSVQDIDMSGSEIMQCGNFASTEAGFRIDSDNDSETNSIILSDNHFERCRYRDVEIIDSDAVKLRGGKVHGRLTVDDAVPDQVDNIHAEGCNRLVIEGVQIAHCRHRCIYVEGGTSDATIIGNTFFGMANYDNDSNGAWGIVVGNDSEATVSNNAFVKPLTEVQGLNHASYITYGADIQARTGSKVVGGDNLHLTDHPRPVHLNNGGTLGERRLSAIWVERKNDINRTWFQGTVVGDNDSRPRFIIQTPGILKWRSDDAASPDLILQHYGADVLSMDDNDSIRIRSDEATGGHVGGELIVEDNDGVPWFSWPDRTGRIRVRSTAPTNKNSDGKIIGPGLQVVSGHAGVSDSDTPGDDYSGLCVINDNDSKIWCRFGSTWKGTAALTP